MLTGNDYLGMFNSCVLTTDPTRVIEIKFICKVMIQNQSLYWEVEKATGIPWLVVAAIHYRESDQSFKYHLHNGDPLTARTVHVPADRPVDGTPPFTWQFSAVDALMHTWQPFTWDVPGMLEFCERYNGLGYRDHGLNSPYLWACTDKYTSGLFVADGKLNLVRKDSRPGVAALFKMVSEWGKVPLDFSQLDTPNSSIH